MINWIEQCWECNKGIRPKDVVWIPVHKNNDPFEPVCRKCAVEIYGACEEDEA